MKGIPGIGDKGAAQLLEEYDNLTNILAHKDEVKGRKGRLLTEFEDLALKTKEMIELHKDVPVKDLSLQSGSVENITWEQVTNFFEDLKFRLLLKRMNNLQLFQNINNLKNDKNSQNKNPEQLGLF